MLNYCFILYSISKILLKNFMAYRKLKNIKSNQKQTVQALYEHLEQALKEHDIELD